MEWYVILSLVLVIPLIVIPVALIWYINAGGVYLAIKVVREKRAARNRKTGKEAPRKHAAIERNVVVPVPPYWWYLP